MKQKLFTTVSNRAQASVVATRQEMYENLVSHDMAVFNPRNWVHENPRFGENEVKSLCKTYHLNNQEIHLGFIEYTSSGRRSISNKFNKLLVAVDTLSPSSADCERGFSAMNNIINDRRSLITTNNAANLLFISTTVGPPSQAWDPDPYVSQNMAWKRKKSSSLNKWHEMAIFKMHNTFFVFLICTIGGGQKVDMFLIAFLQLWLKFWDGIDKY